MSENIIQQQGKIKLVLNDYFGLISGPLGAAADKESSCLFDTYDLHLRDGETANEAEKMVGDVLKVGDIVVYNACLINQENPVPYLATGVWKPGTVTAVEPVPRNMIQESKIDIYDTVHSLISNTVIINYTTFQIYCLHRLSSWN